MIIVPGSYRYWTYRTSTPTLDSEGRRRHGGRIDCRWWHWRADRRIDVARTRHRVDASRTRLAPAAAGRGDQPAAARRQRAVCARAGRRAVEGRRRARLDLVLRHRRHTAVP